MKVIEDLPFYIVIIAVALNLILGIVLKVDFITLTTRSIVVTILFSVVGYILSNILSSAIKAAEQESKEVKSIIDIKVPPIDESELLQYGKDDEDEFVEMKPEMMKNNKMT